MRKTNQSSDIFEAYAKSMQEQGLVKKADENDTKPSKDLEWDAYSYFYPKKSLLGATLDIEGKPYDMLDKAHPELIIASPAYDAVNGLVENLKERSNIMNMIARRTPRIIQTNERYVKALNELLEETVKSGFFLDSKNMPKLASLADLCSQQIVKEADGTVPVAIGGGVAAAVAAAGIYGGLAFPIVPIAAIGWIIWAARFSISSGIKADLDMAIEEMEEAITPHTFTSSIPKMAPIVQPVINIMRDILKKVTTFYDTTDKVQGAVLKIKSSPTDQKQKLLSDFSTQFITSGELDNIEKLAKEIKDGLDNLSSAIPDIIQAFEEAPNKYKENSIWNFLAPVRDVFYGALGGRETDDAADRLEIVKEDIPSFYEFINTFLGGLQSVKAQVIKSVPKETPESPSNVTKPLSNTIEEVKDTKTKEQEAKELRRAEERKRQLQQMST